MTGKHIHGHGNGGQTSKGVDPAEWAAHTAHVCVVNEGVTEVTGADSAPVTLQPGDLVLLPRGPRELKLTVGASPGGRIRLLLLV